ncbi:MAG TPA: NADP transhydrogenase subunit alpha [Bacillus bacterium]|uniref:NAD/NADP-dependent octopine/nopaline dehydrogenase family protein n=1 Tax=Siminovitchia fordii TaxID=254759 RepID=UPI0003712623|nr:NAD/NADP-dependent octopine/nopaline dehydrogenase family protein [Siminovitchia fordii]HBZ09944.1 NADP transhydrogenase subunit alpha [Bacillus sp. (in: firmicutes)]
MKFTIIGAGNGGQSMAAHLALLGYEISLYDIQDSLIESINEKGGIKVEGVIHGFAPLKATTDLEIAMQDTDIVMITTTGTAHKAVARSIAPYLQDEQVILILPGYWGALEFRNVFNQIGMSKKVYVSETESLIYTCRYIEPGHVRIRKIKESLEFSALPASDSVIVKERLKEVYPQLVMAGSVLVTTLNNCNPVFHVPITLLNAGRIESNEEFFFYPEGATPSVVNVMEEVDKERLNIGRQLGVELTPALDLLRRFYQVEGDTLYEGIQRNLAYQTGKAPTTLNYRYIYEDIPYGLHPMVKLGEKLRVNMTCSNLLIDMASYLMKENLRAGALDLSDLGLAEMSSVEMVEYLRGEKNRR